nr:hypothetical protein [Jeotgalibacillus malaysiensis]
MEHTTPSPVYRTKIVNPNIIHLQGHQLKKLESTLELYRKNPNHDHQLQSAIEFIAKH